MTFLAFIYVPLNLATSIFGMNLQQLNNNGKQFWIFLITAVVALFLTFFTWLLVEHFEKLVCWRKQIGAVANNNDPWPQRGKEYNILIRLNILILLFQIGHHRWAWHSGAWLRILTNDRAGFRHIPTIEDKAESANGDFMKEYLTLFNSLTACDYCCEHIRYGQSTKAFSAEAFSAVSYQSCS